MPRPQPVFLALALLLTAVPVAHAQLGGLKKKVADKVTGRDTVAVAGKGGGKVKCDASSMVITADVVDRYLKAYAARDAEILKLAKEPTKTGAYYAALLKRNAIQKRKDEFELRRGPDWEKYKAINKRRSTGDTLAVREQAALSESLDPNSVTLPELAWEDQQKRTARLDSVMIAGGGFSACDWTDLGERLPWIVSTLVNDPNAKDFGGKGTAKDAAVIRPRLAELALGMGIDYVTPEEKARREQHKKAEDEALVKVVTTSGDPQTDCIMKAQQDWAKAHKAELDAAQKSKDQGAIMRLSLEMNQAAAKCVSSSEE